jgi:hypothetical protein
VGKRDRGMEVVDRVVVLTQMLLGIVHKENI